MIHIGDRVIAFSGTKSELRGFVTSILQDTILIELDSGKIAEIPKEFVERIVLIPAHSIEYLRTVPIHMRPFIY